MLATTSRYSPQALRDFAKAFAIAFGGAYVARGKKTIDSLVSEARKKGHSRICVAMPETIEFISVDELENWKWLDEVIVVKSKSFSAKGVFPCREITGSDSGKLIELLDFEPDEKAELEIIAEAGKIKLIISDSDKSEGNSIPANFGPVKFEMDVSYEMHKGKMQDRAEV
ncbi:MAG: hypothetical protein WCT31_05825 [Candidatus Micrarchaeia archaeon]